MKYRKPIKWSIILASLIIGLAGCEGPGPEYQTPMTAYPEAQNNSLPIEMTPAPKMAYEEIYREKKPQNLRTVLLFNSSKAQLTSAQKQKLKRQASYLKENPHARIKLKVAADAKRKATRANEITQFFKTEGISAERLEIVSVGAKKSLARNHRVDLIILPEGKSKKS